MPLLKGAHLVLSQGIEDDVLTLIVVVLDLVTRNAEQITLAQ